jgi:hypothetical protein
MVNDQLKANTLLDGYVALADKAARAGDEDFESARAIELRRKAGDALFAARSHGANLPDTLQALDNPSRGVERG